MIDTLFQILEVATSVLVVTTLYLIPRGYKWWLAYAANSILFLVVMAYFGRYPPALMGLCLGVTAVRNYCTGKKKEESKIDEKGGEND